MQRGARARRPGQDGRFREKPNEHQEAKNIENQIFEKSWNGIEDRISKLEVGDANTISMLNESGGIKERGHGEGCAPRHMILGGWPQNSERKTIEEDARRGHDAFQMDVKDKCLIPDSPQKWGEIAKVKVQEGYNKEVACKLARISEKRDAASRPAWAAVERSPREGRRRSPREG